MAAVIDMVLLNLWKSSHPSTFHCQTTKAHQDKHMQVSVLCLMCGLRTTCTLNRAKWENVFLSFFKKKKWISEAPLPVSLDSTRINQSGKEIIPPPKKKSHISISNNFQTSQVIVSLLILFVSFLYLSKKYILALSLKSSLLLFCRQQLHVVSYISFLINNIIPNWWPHHLSLAWDEKKAIIDSWL